MLRSAASHTSASAAGCLVALTMAACSRPPALALPDTAGAWQQPLQLAAETVHAIVLLSPECPIANAYAPTLRELASRYAGQPVRFFLVHLDPSVDAAAASAHAAAYQLPGSILLDPQHRLVAALGGQRTPEAFVLATHGEPPFGLLYRGRIDDRWQATGARTVTAETRDLDQAIAAALAGQRPATAATEVIGCLLPEPRPRD